ncbi:SGNH hydrolase [Coniochaeta ligniaria NRRL 30616]|uniref:SGNH hydrolase n=1 Tax=Coniochaeta ligniaria NRRL 30616 TaxID=1408157 RepID=A0A1J7IGT8_9PEZI|nr:SGNH hydrolase [Coniochaeta ligniaria NRRL 30616]
MTAVGVVNALPPEPIQTNPSDHTIAIRADQVEWTSFGDSYATGVGGGTYTDGSYRCLRYDKAYPVLMNADPRLGAGEHVFHNAACSGSGTTDVELYQFYDEDTSGTPNWQYGFRPRFGNPSVGTLSVGGNNIDFPGIIMNCMLEWNGPGGFGHKKLPCRDQLDLSQGLVVSPDLEEAIDNTIKKIVDRARKGPIGDKFKLYVTGYPEFFNEKTDDCDTRTFAIEPKEDSTLLTKDMRKELNGMSVQLNKAVENAVTKNANMGVKWIPINQLMEGHHEKRKPELEAIYQKAVGKVDANKFRTTSEWLNTVFENIDIPEKDVVRDTFFRDMGPKFQTFHPQIVLHEKIRDMILDDYAAGGGGGGPAPPAKDENKCHGVSGDYWIMSRDAIVPNIKEFCGQADKKKIFNVGSVNELELSVNKLGDDAKGPRDAPDCEGRFTRAVVDGCDGLDPKNPDNWKFGGTLTTTDGWQYTMTPKSKNVDDVTCDVSYRFFYDRVEIRGRNVPGTGHPPPSIRDDGTGLLDALRNECGVVTDWKFDPKTPVDGGDFQWYAAGSLVIGKRSCAGTAIMKAGADRVDNCHGAGRRRGVGGDGGEVEGRTVYRRASIDKWPGYGGQAMHDFSQSGTAIKGKRAAPKGTGTTSRAARAVTAKTLVTTTRAKTTGTSSKMTGKGQA